MQLLTFLSSGFARALQVVLYFLVSIGYAVGCEWRFRGQTLGKRLLKLQVIDEEGLKLRFSQIMLRNLLRAVDLLPAFYLLGGIFSLATRKGQRLGDLAARTVVIRHTQIQLPDVEQILPGRFNSFLDYPHLVARIRKTVSPGEVDIAIQALLRREELSAQARLELFSALSDHFQSLVPFPEEVHLDLTPEQYVRNIVHIFCQPHAH